MLRTLTLVAWFTLSGCSPSDQGITSLTHQQHIGGMVFASAQIQRGAENPAAFKDTCVLGEPCYGRFYLRDPLRTVAKQRGESGSLGSYLFALRATVDQHVLGEAPFEMMSWWSTYNFTLFRADGDTTPWEHPSWFLNQVARRIPPGTHDLRLDIVPVTPGAKIGSGTPIASGHVQFVIPANGALILARAISREGQIMQAAHMQQEAAAREWNRQAEQSQATQGQSQQPTCKGESAAVGSSSECCSGHARSVPNGGYACCSNVGVGDCRW